ncbi:MAG: leucine-rich repeat domain-containing protein [Paludibacteraceae bacterium]|nr:leucine-rich repeat domain-containing protein [Paludibacteraceae bacterium]
MADAIRNLPTGGDKLWEWTRPDNWPNLDILGRAINEQYDSFYLGTLIFDDPDSDNNLISFQTTSTTELSLEIGYESENQFVLLKSISFISSIQCFINNEIPEEDRRSIYVVRVVPSSGKSWDGPLYLGYMPNSTETQGRGANRVFEVITRQPGLSMSAPAPCSSVFTQRVRYIDMEMLGSSFNSVVYSNVLQIEFVGCDFSKITTYNGSSGGFSKCASLKRLFSNTPLVTAACTNTSGLFNQCKNLLSIDCSDWDMSNVTVVASMFNNCVNLQEIKFLQLGSKITSASSFCAGCSNLREMDLSSTVLTKATSIAYLFSNCTNLEHVKVPSSTYASTNIGYIAENCYKLRELDLSGIDGTALKDNMMTSFISNNFLMENLKLPQNMSLVTQLSLSSLINLTAASLANIIADLVDQSASTAAHTLTIGAANKNKLTEEQLAVAASKGWSVV